MLSVTNISVSLQGGVNDRASSIQVLLLGNRCGHDPKAPRFYATPIHHKLRPTLLESIKKSLKTVYNSPKQFVNKLVTFHKNNRQVRSERREAVTAVAQVIAEHVDLGSLKVGIPHKSGFQSLSLEYFAKQTGFTFLRIQRAIKELEEGGYLDVSRQFKKNADGTFSSSPSVRKVTTKFFIDAGADIADVASAVAWKRREQQKIAKALAKKIEKENQQKMSKTVTAIIS